MIRSIIIKGPVMIVYKDPLDMIIHNIKNKNSSLFTMTYAYP